MKMIFSKTQPNPKECKVWLDEHGQLKVYNQSTQKWIKTSTSGNTSENAPENSPEQESKIITFWINIGDDRGITEYKAERGMTWGEWVDSEYNVDGFVIQYDEASYQYEVVCIETVENGWSGTHYLIADPDKSAPTHVLKTEIVQSKEYTEFKDNYGVGVGGGGE